MKSESAVGAEASKSRSRVPGREPPDPILARRRLMRALDESLMRRLTVITADAGYGKSVLLGAWASSVPSVWYTVGPNDASLAVLVLGIAQAFERRLPALSDELRLVVHTSLGPNGDEAERAAPVATLVCEAVEESLPDDFALVFDDVHELGRKGPSVRLLEQLCRQAPPRLHLVLASRLEPPFPVQRLRGRAEVVDVDAAMLAFDVEEIGELMAALLDGETESLAPSVYELTAGWPAAVRLTVEALRAAPAGMRLEALEELHRPGGRLFSYVAEEVFARAAPGVRQLLRHVAPFERFNVELCRAIGVKAAGESLVELRRAGLFLETREAGDGWFGLHALIRQFVRERWPLDETEQRDVCRRAAEWFETNGCFGEALESMLAIGQADAAAALLEEHGSELLAAGRVEVTIRFAERLPPERRSAAIEQLVGEAHEIRGEWDEALECFKRAAGRRRRLEAGLAWRLGLIHHLRGRLDEAIEAYDRAQLDGSSLRDSALLLAWKASAYWLRGDGDHCRSCAEDAFARASGSGDARALAAAHTVLAMLAALSGDRLANDAHYLRALEYAERAGDVVQTVRIRTNRGSRHIEEGEYEQALVELEIALRLADLTGFVSFRALALNNRGDAHFRLGRLEEAIADLQASQALYQRTGSQMVSYPLVELGNVFSDRGETAMAHAFFEEAATRAEESGDAQGLVPALAGLARLLASDEPERARALAERALSFGEGMAHVGARLALGWVALVGGEREEAAASAEAAAAAARLRRDRAGLAQALELAALASEDHERQAVLLEEAISIWRGIGDPLGEARAEVLRGLTAGASGAARVEQAERRLRAAGAHGYRALLTAVMPSLLPAPSKALSITTLGRFAVTRAGRPIGRDEWQSRKARDLLKLLVARRGRPTPRERLMDALWPDEEPRRLANRLSVALSTLRTVFDPEHRYAPDEFLFADASVVALRTENVDIDLDAFFDSGERGLGLYRQGRTAEALPQLESAEASYVGDFLEEDLYEDWAVPLREEARALYLAVTTALAELADHSRDYDAAVSYRLRLLQRDPYDETAHLGVAASLAGVGRHGEARRAYRRYVARMAEIGVEAAPFPSVRAATDGPARAAAP